MKNKNEEKLVVNSTAEGDILMCQQPNEISLHEAMAEDQLPRAAIIQDPSLKKWTGLTTSPMAFVTQPPQQTEYFVQQRF